MKRKLITIFLSVVFLNILSIEVSAFDVPSPTSLTNFGEVITRVSSLVTPTAVLGFIGSIIYAGYTRMIPGSSDREEKSMKIAVGAAIGFGIIALAPLLVQILGGIFKVDPNIVS